MLPVLKPEAISRNYDKMMQLSMVLLKYGRVYRGAGAGRNGQDKKRQSEVAEET
jgi:hypothetical protein